MIDLSMSIVMFLVLILPLLLFAAVAIPVTRAPALRLVPWAALPALLAALIVAEGGLHMPVVLLNSTLTLDVTGRAFLLLNAILWLAGGWLDGFREQSTATVRRALFYLLAMTGAFGMALADDAVVFFVSSTLAGYALYGLLVSGADSATQRAGRLLVVLLVVSDLLVFEVLLMLAHGAGEVGFPALRAAFQGADNQGLLLGLLIAGFGVRCGVIGLHIWMRPVFVTSRVALLPVLAGFAISGWLGWLRLLPFGDVAWPVAGNALQWLAWLGLVYVVVTGVMQTHYRAIIVCTIIVFSALWLSAIGTALHDQQTWRVLFEAMLATAPLAGFALSALLLLGQGITPGRPAWAARFTVGLSLLVAASLLLVTLGIASLTARINADGMMQLYAVAAVFAFLLTRALFFMAENTTQPVIHGNEDRAPPVFLPASVFAIGALVFSADTIAALSLAELKLPVLLIIVAAFSGWLSFARRGWITSVTAFPGLHMTARRHKEAVVDRGRALLSMNFLRAPVARLRLVRRSWFVPARWLFAGRIELGFRRWYIAMIMLVFLGALLAWLGGN